ncbi:MAG TPA: O-antigen ligase family protein, partial [Chloroflexota bacterium]|nr:O-antigen ligase family protein [Chloroflexota bacterium]
ATGRADILIAGGIALIVPLSLLWNLEAGVLALVVLRPSMDLLADRSIGSYGGHALNPASLTALMVIGVGLAALVERARLALTSPVIVPFVLFTVVAAVGVPLAPSVSAAATEWLRLCSILIGYCLLYVVLTGQEKVRHALIAVLLSGAIPALVGIGQFVAGGKRTIGDYSRLTGTFLHPDPYGIYLGLLTVLAVALYAAAKGYVRPVSLVLLPLLIAALVGSYTRTGWAIALAGVLVVGVLRSRWLLLLVPVVVVAVVVAVPSTTARVNDVSANASPYGQNNSFQSRVKQWRTALPKATRRPLTGLGLTSIVRESSDAELVHSDYIRTLVETGVFGFAAYVWLMLAAVWSSAKAVRLTRSSEWPLKAAALAGTSVGVAYLIASGDSNLITQPAVSGTAWAILACAHAARRLA